GIRWTALLVKIDSSNFPGCSFTSLALAGPITPPVKMNRDARRIPRAASSSPSSPREERVGRGPRRGETNKNAPPLPSPLLHPMEEREKSGSLMQPWDTDETPNVATPPQPGHTAGAVRRAWAPWLLLSP